jgi:hypothetical protein
MSCPKDFIGHPDFNSVINLWIPAQNLCGNDSKERICESIKSKLTPPKIDIAAG